MSETLKTPKEYGYVMGNNICLFQKGPLSQFYGGFSGQSSDFYMDERGYPTNPKDILNCCEQWMMASKAAIFNDKVTFNKIMAEKNPANHKALGRQIKNFAPKVWDEYKYDIVFEGNMWKFQQNAHLKKFLLQFPIDTIFAEASPWDTVWGIGLAPEDPRALDIKQWQGENLLGKVISEVRKAL